MGFVNNAQGFIRTFSTCIYPAGYTYATSAIIEVPRNKGKLLNLPAKCSPLAPLTWTFIFLVHIDPEKPDEFRKCKYTAVK